MTSTHKINEMPGALNPRISAQGQRSKVLPEDPDRKLRVQNLAVIPDAPRKLSALVKDLRADHRVKPCVAFENEFYLINSGRAPSQAFLEELELDLSRANVEYTLTAESGQEQFEISTRPSEDVVTAAEEVVQIRRTLSKLACQRGYRVSFGARPIRDRPGSGLHVHTSLHGSHGENLFAKMVGERSETSHMLQAVAGLLAAMPGSMTIFAPSKGSYRRYWQGEKSARSHYDFVPSFISWGGDNRTVALRIPESSSEPERRRLEHRVPCSDADPLSVTTVIIAGIKYGLENRLYPSKPKTWGLVGTLAEKLVELPKNLAEAKAAFRNCTIVRPYLISMA